MSLPKTRYPKDCRETHNNTLDRASEVMATGSDRAAASYSEGAILGALGRYEEAIKSYEEAIRIKPDYFDAWYTKGNTLGNLGRYEEAIESFEQAIRIKPDDVEAW